MVLSCIEMFGPSYRVFKDLKEIEGRQVKKDERFHYTMLFIHA